MCSSLSFPFLLLYLVYVSKHFAEPLGWEMYRNSDFLRTGHSPMMQDWIFSKKSFFSPESIVTKPTSVSLPLYGSVHGTAYWFADVHVGSPESQLQSLIVDTGSSVMGFPCSDCRDRCGSHIDAPYNISGSQSIRPVECVESCPLCAGRTRIQFREPSNAPIPPIGQCAYHIRYTEGSSLTGIWYKDNVVLSKDAFDSSNSKSSFSVQIPFGCHSEETHLFVSQDASGILGLEATSRFGPAPFVTSVLANLLDLKQIKGGSLRDLGLSGMSSKSATEPVFAMCISQHGGILTIGAQNDGYHVNPEPKEVPRQVLWETLKNRSRNNQATSNQGPSPVPLQKKQPFIYQSSVVNAPSFSQQNEVLYSEPSPQYSQQPTPSSSRVSPQFQPSPRGSYLGNNNIESQKIAQQNVYPSSQIVPQYNYQYQTYQRQPDFYRQYDDTIAPGIPTGIQRPWGGRRLEENTRENGIYIEKNEDEESNGGDSSILEEFAIGEFEEIDLTEQVNQDHDDVKMRSAAENRRKRGYAAPARLIAPYQITNPTASEQVYYPALKEGRNRWTPLVLDPEEEGGWPGSYVAILQGWKIKGAEIGETILTVPTSRQPQRTRTSESFGLPALVDSGTTLTYIPFLLYANLWTALLRNVAAAAAGSDKKRERRLLSDEEGVVRVSGTSISAMKEKLHSYINKLREQQTDLMMETRRQMKEKKSLEGYNPEAGDHESRNDGSVEDDLNSIEGRISRELKIAERLRFDIDQLELHPQRQTPSSVDQSVFDELREAMESGSAVPRVFSQSDDNKSFPDRRSLNDTSALPLRRLVPVEVPNLDEECWFLSNMEEDLKFFPDMLLQFANRVEHVWRPTSYLYKKGKTKVYCMTIVPDGDDDVEQQVSSSNRTLSSSKMSAQMSGLLKRKLQKEVKQAVLGSSFFINHDLVFHLGRWEVAFYEATCPSTDMEKRAPL